MKRLFAVLTLCASTLIAASAVSSPAAADGRHDGRRHAGQFERQTSSYFTNRGEHRRAFKNNRDRRYYKFRRQHRGHRHAHRYSRWPGYGYGYGRPRHQYSYRRGSAFAFNGARFIFRFD